MKPENLIKYIKENDSGCYDREFLETLTSPELYRVKSLIEKVLKWNLINE